MRTVSRGWHVPQNNVTLKIQASTNPMPAKTIGARTSATSSSIGIRRGGSTIRLMLTSLSEGPSRPAGKSGKVSRKSASVVSGGESPPGELSHSHPVMGWAMTGGGTTGTENR